MLGFLGGIFGLAHSVAFIFVQFIADRQFYSFVISKVYANDPPITIQDCSIRSNNRKLEENKVISRQNFTRFNCGKVKPFNESSNPIQQHNIQSNNFNEEFKLQLFILIYCLILFNQALTCTNCAHLKNKREENKITSCLDDSHIDYKHNRLWINNEVCQDPAYSCKDLFFELFCLHKCKFKCKPCERLRNRRQLFHRHVDNFKSETDCLRIVSSIRELQDIKQQIRETMEQSQLVIEAYQQSKYFDSNLQIESCFQSN